MTDPRDIAELFRTMLADDPGRPRITWYGTGGERVELSAKVLDNWVAKTANLLVDGLDAEPGTRVGLDLPGHWRTAVWLLGIWSAGACAVTLPADRLDVLVTSAPVALPPPAGPVTVAIALPALAATAGPLPPGVVDGGAEVRIQPDRFVAPLRPEPDDPALDAGSGPGAGSGGPTSHAELLPAAGTAARQRGWPLGVRLLVPATVTVAQSPVWLLGPLSRNGSVVLVGPDAGLDLDRITAQEGATADFSSTEPT